MTRALFVLLLASAVGCGEASPLHAEGATSGGEQKLPDAGVPDAGARPQLTPDAGVADSGTTSVDGAADGGVPRDAGTPDAGSAEDAGSVDAGAPDAGGLDAGGCVSDNECPQGQFCDSSQTPAACFTPPIQHVIIVIKENHTFDNYFGSFPNVDGTTTAVSSTGPVTITEAPDVPSHDLCHTHACALTDLDDGKMDGWSVDGGSDVDHDGLAYAQYYEQDIPNYWAYANAYTLGDHFFAAGLGPSFPGHLYTLAAQAAGAVDDPGNIFPWGCDTPSAFPVNQVNPTTGIETQVAPCFNIPSLPDLLPPNLGWRFYGTDYTDGLGGSDFVWSMFAAIQPIYQSTAYTTNLVSESDFMTDVQNGTLPALTWLVNQDGDDEHPGSCISVCAGENFTVDYLNSIMTSPLWASTAILITWDDFGGWYDHVPPPVTVGNAQNPLGWGMRLPLLVISPYARPHYVFSTPSSQSSLVRFAERVLGVHASLHDIDPNAQDSAVDDLFGAFDFHQTPNQPLVLQQRTCPSLGIPFVCPSEVGL